MTNLYINLTKNLYYKAIIYNIIKLIILDLRKVINIYR